MLQDHREISGPPTVRVLLADTNWWANSARLAIGLAEAGCDVSAICPKPNHALTKTHAVRQTFRYRGLHPIESLIAAIEAVDPGIVIPACDRSVRHLHELYVRAKAQGRSGMKLAALIEQSLGLSTSYPVVSSRYDLLALAREEGILVPETVSINNQDDIDRWRTNQLFPWMLKADGTWGGGGVRVIRSVEDARQSLGQLEEMSRFTRSVKRLVVNRDPFWLREWWIGSRRSIVAQSYVNGRPANCTAFCWRGKVLALIAVEVVRSDGATGPASIVSVVDNIEMTRAAEKIAARLELSGFFGLDFMIETGTGRAYLIEMNPRLAPPSHLRLGTGKDLPGALWAQLSGQPYHVSQSVTEHRLVAYFPQGEEDSQEFGENCFQDIPGGEPDLLAEMLRPFPDRTLLFRMVALLTRPGNVNGNKEGIFLDHEVLKHEEEMHTAGIRESVRKAGTQST